MFWCALSGARERVGNHSRYPYTHHPETPWHGQSHIFTRMCAVLASAGIRDVPQTPVLPCDSVRQARVRAWLANHGLAPRGYVLMHAGASATRPAKRWPHFAGLAARVRAAGMRIVWLGSEPERALNASLCKDGDADATGQFDILELAEVGRSARCAVTNDSGPMHVLAAANIPVYALFGPSDWRRNHALGQADRVFACVDYDARYTGAACADCLPAMSAEVVFARLVADGMLNVDADGDME
jgi:ADP-heptose:LPS heptosyltransferase